MDYEKIKLKFDEYVNTFDMTNKNVKLKYNHSLSTATLMTELAFRLELSKEEIILAKTIGLLHDIGRFEQVTKYNSYEDADTMDHADYGVKYLFKENHIREFIEDEKYDQLIAKAILYHNKINIPNDLTEEESMYCKMIRDMDKVDIYKQLVINDNVEFNEKDISDKVIEKFNKKEMVNNLEVKTKTDGIIRYMAFLYDINYKESFDILIDTDNFEFYLSMIEVDEKSENKFNELKTICLEVIKNKEMKGDNNVREEIQS